MRCLSIPSTPAVRAPPEAKVTRAASASQVLSVISRRSRSNLRSLFSVDHLASLSCISPIIKGLHLITVGQFAAQATSDCSPSPCDRLSLSLTTTRAPPTWSASGDTLPSHLFQAFPSSHVWTQSHGRGCLSQSFSLLAASRHGWFGLATLSPNRRPDHETVDPVAVGQHIHIADRYPRPADKVVSAGVTFQPSDAFQ